MMLCEGEKVVDAVFEATLIARGRLITTGLPFSVSNTVQC